MKKTLIGTGIALMAVISLSSCKKDYSCSCTVTTAQEAFVFGGVTISEASTTTATGITIINGKKKDVEASCTAGSSTVTNPGGQTSGSTTITTVCTILD